MKEYEVVIKETNIYRIIVEVENESQADAEAYKSEKYVNGICDDTDSEIVTIKEI